MQYDFFPQLHARSDVAESGVSIINASPVGLEVQPGGSQACDATEVQRRKHVILCLIRYELRWLFPYTPVLSSKCNVKIQAMPPTSTTGLLAAEPGAQPALRLRSILGDLTIEPVNGSIEVLAGLASELLAPNPGFVPLLLCVSAQGVVLRLGLGAVLLGLVLRVAAVLLGLILCLLSVGLEVGLGLLRLGAGAVGLLLGQHVFS